MASWMVHFRIADILMRELEINNRELFIVGSIAPDCGEWDDATMTYNPPSMVTHFARDHRKSDCDYKRFRAEYLLNCEDDARDFYLGYYYHLITDVLWVRDIAAPSRTKNSPAFEVYQDYIRAVKENWYALDHDYLRENPNFGVYHEFSEIQHFKNKYLPYYNERCIENQIHYIQDFYSKYPERVHYRYLSRQEMDSFVERSSNEMLK